MELLLQNIYYVFSIVGTILTPLAIYFSYKQLKKMSESNQQMGDSYKLTRLTSLAEYTQIRIQSTIDTYNEINKEIQPFIDKVLFKKIDVSVENITNNYELQYDVRRYISLMCRFSIGIDAGVYDFRTFDRLHGKTTLDMYTFLEPYIRHVSNEKGEYFYEGFNRLADKLKQIRAQRSMEKYSGELEKFPTYIEDTYKIYIEEIKEYLMENKLEKK